jgi:hypothetical protein
MYLQTVYKEVGEVEVTQMVDPRVDLKIVHRHSVLFHRHPHASVADQDVQPAIIRVSITDIQRLPTTLFLSVLRKEYFECPERLLRSTLHLIEGGEGSLYPRTFLAVPRWLNYCCIMQILPLKCRQGSLLLIETVQYGV